MDLFLVTVHSFKQHTAWVIAINSNSSLPNDVMLRQGLIDKWWGVRVRTCLRGYLPKNARVSKSSLVLVTVHSFKPHYAWVIVINSNNRLLNYVVSRQGVIDSWGVTCSNILEGVRVRTCLRGVRSRTCLRGGTCPNIPE